MTIISRDSLVEKFREAAARGEYELADEYFYAALEAGADEMDKNIPGSGEPWRAIGRSMRSLRDEIKHQVTESGATPPNTLS